MACEYKRTADLKPLYDYYIKVKNCVPYWFDADYELWFESYDNDTDYDADKMFSELMTYAAYAENNIVGFVQFGISNYFYNENGEKDFSEKCGVIRNLYFDSDNNCGEKLISLADEYFAEKNISKKSAFFHALGMTCNAGHGKLYCGLPHIEAALLKCGYIKEHENVYYKRMLKECDAASDTVSVSYKETNLKGLQEFSIVADGKDVGAGALVYLPQGEICYLKWIYIYDTEQRKGYASSALKTLFFDLYNNGIRRFDTDTADGNIIAQKLYTKVGFTDMGRTRSYLK
ncbi:MAG: GNAT family N-acetyltransferase [Oscillospiraceae bacterium]|nr:GNAT family N-acetyltransferase [Oscillospiraceae bacterium]